MRDGRTMNEQGKIELLNLETEFCNFSVFWSDFHVLLSVFEFVFVSARELPGPDCCFVSGSAELNFSEVGDRQVVWDNRTTQIL